MASGLLGRDLPYTIVCTANHLRVFSEGKSNMALDMDQGFP
jgi:hypothetical protein